MSLSSWVLFLGSASIMNEMIDFEYDRRTKSQMLIHVLGVRRSLAIVVASHVYFSIVLLASAYLANYLLSVITFVCTIHELFGVA